MGALGPLPMRGHAYFHVPSSPLNMRTSLTLLALTPFLALGQSLVSQAPQNRHALLEDFTGIHCGYCPEGHVIAHDLKAAHPNDVVVVGVHAGVFADPNPGEPDLRTVPGTTINDHFGVNSYPAGIVDRHSFQGGVVQGRGAWEGMVNEVLTFSSPVNLGLESSFDSGTRELTVTVELYYTANSPSTSDYISVLLMEDHIIGWQTDYTNGNQPNYDHTNVLRDYITPVWGDEVTTTTAGISVTRTYTYTVPTDWDISNCQVVGFVSEFKTEVYQVRQVPADGGTTLIVGELASTAGNAYQAGSNGTALSLGNNMTNALGADEDYLITLSSTDAPADWAAQFMIMGTAYSGPAVVTIPAGATEDITVSITPGATVGIANYTLSVSSTTNTNAPELVQEYHVISGVTDLVVNNPQADAHQPIYNGALASANQPGRASTDRNTFVGFGDAGALGGVYNVYANISWTFPSITDALVAVLEDHLDNGGNLFIAGQDIGWDQSNDPNAYGTPITQAFYTNYMHATYVADGSTANSSVNFEDTDLVFGGLPNSNINSVFGTNSYPEEIAPIAPAVATLRYNNPNKIGGLRVDNGTYKVVYFGVGPEQMSTASVGQDMVRLSHDWFYGIVSVEELDHAFADLGAAWPVPTDDVLRIPLGEAHAGALLQVSDATGRIVAEHRLVVQGQRFDLDVSDLSEGLYTYRLVDQAGRSAARSFVVAH